MEQETLTTQQEDSRNRELLQQARAKLELFRQSLAGSPSGAEGEVAFQLLQAEVEVRRA